MSGVQNNYVALSYFNNFQPRTVQEIPPTEKTASVKYNPRRVLLINMQMAHLNTQRAEGSSGCGEEIWVCPGAVPAF